MIRRMVKIDRDKCNGCGLCVQACHEGAIGMVDGKAQLLRDDYCDGLGDCLPACPVGAISFEEREAAAFDKEAVMANMARLGRTPPAGGCPGAAARAIRQEAPADAPATQGAESRLGQWPVQLKLVPIHAPYFQNADLLIAADCAAYAYGGFHGDFMQGRTTLIGCPKLDGVDYAEKLTAILSQNDIRSVTAVRMEVPCCGGLERAVKTALANSGKKIPLQVVTLSVDGRVLDRQPVEAM
ncbi:MAG: 4Fe-4S binding protein [Clostridiales bacterium]|nr:4Fe-4S binding protein [Clostridiales bacterium]